jgi:hypothetical protein
MDLHRETGAWMACVSAALLLAFAGAATGATAANSTATSADPAPAPQEILLKLKLTHPRLLADAARFEQLKVLAATDPRVKAWYETVRKSADKILTEDPSKYEIPDGLRLLATSRRVVDRTYTLALVYRLSGDRRYLDRAWKELEAAAAFKDWNPKHFLDVAEMTHAFAIGYDWLYDVWTKEQRATLREAIITHGLTPAMACYRDSKLGWWARCNHNWNQVCNGGIGMGALAIADEQHDLAGEVLAQVIRNLPYAMKQYAPDGAWGEGPGYWQYATSYNVTILAALATALGNDFGLSKIEGFSQAGLFPIYASGPMGRTFNYADAGDGPVSAPELWWMTDRFHEPQYAVFRDVGMGKRASPLDLLWYTAWPFEKSIAALPLSKYFRGAEVAMLRTAWNSGATFVAFKGGDNKTNHSHLDLGTFVLDALGQRFACDLGGDDYNLPAYFGNQRWTYYRLRAEGHNSLVINPGEGPDQDPKAAAKIIKFESTPERSFGVMDLTAAYAGAESILRGISLQHGTAWDTVTVQDEVTLTKPGDVWWFMHTTADIKVEESGKRATLTAGRARLDVELVLPRGPDVKFEVMDAAPLPGSPHPPKQAANEKVKKLAIHLTNVSNAWISVRMKPAGEDASRVMDRPQPVRLERW